MNSGLDGMTVILVGSDVSSAPVCWEVLPVPLMPAWSKTAYTP